MKSITRYETVVIPDPDPESVNPPTLLAADVTTFDDGVKHFVFALHQDNRSDRWDTDKVSLRSEVVNTISGYGDAYDPNRFRYFEHNPGSARPYEEFKFKKQGDSLFQVGTSKTYSAAEFHRINSPEQHQDY